MVQRIQWLVIALLAVALGVLGYGRWQGRALEREVRAAHRAQVAELRTRLAQAEQRTPAADRLDLPESALRVPAAVAGDPGPDLSDVEHWRARLAEDPENGRHGWALVRDLLKSLPPDEALAVFAELWSEMSVPVKEQGLKPFVFGSGHPHALKALDLAARDGTVTVQGRAFQYLGDIAFRDFGEDYEAYLAWAEGNRDRPLGEVMADSGRDFVARLGILTPEEAAAQLDHFGDANWEMAAREGVDLRAIVRDAGGLASIEGWLGVGGEVAGEALEWVQDLRPDEPWMRQHVLPMLEQAGEDVGVASRAAAAFARPGCEWAVEPLAELMLERGRRGDPQELDYALQIAQSLGQIGDARAIPSLIAMIDEDVNGNAVYDVGYYGLGRLTGVSYDETHDGAWWRDWWEKNQGRLPAEVQGMEIPGIK